MATAVVRPLTGFCVNEMPFASAGSVWPFGIGIGPIGAQGGAATVTAGASARFVVMVVVLVLVFEPLIAKTERG